MQKRFAAALGERLADRRPCRRSTLVSLETFRATVMAPDADIVRLEANRTMRLAGGRAIAAAPGRKLYRALSGSSGSAAYILSRQAAKWIVEAAPTQHLPVDNFLFKPKVSEVARKLRRFQIVPAVCIQDELLERSDARLKSQIKSRATRGRGYRERSNPLLKLWPLMRHAVPFRP